jgi:transposase
MAKAACFNSGGNTMCETFAEEEFAAYVGIDWADKINVGCLNISGSEERELFELEQKPAAIQEWAYQLRDRFPGKKIAIALEQSNGGLFNGLMKYDFLVLFSINPKTQRRYREALRTSGAKDDPSDGELLMMFLQKHRKQLRSFRATDPATRQLARLVENRRKLVDESSALSNRIGSLLKSYFPQALDWVGDLKSVMACDFLVKWPTLNAIKKAKPEMVRKFYYRHNCRNRDLIERRLTEIRSAVAITADEAIIAPAAMMLRAWVAQVRTIVEHTASFDDKIEEHFESYPDRYLYKSLPGAGPVLEPRLAAAMGLDRDRYQTAAELQQFSGTAPVTVMSGKSCWIHVRWACNKFYRQTFVEFAECSLPYCSWAKEFYDWQKVRGKGRHAILRALAFKWQRILFRCWKDGKPYNEDLHLQNQLRRNSKLLVSAPVPVPWKSKSGFIAAGEILQNLATSVQKTVQKQSVKCEH